MKPVASVYMDKNIELWPVYMHKNIEVLAWDFY